LTVKTSGWPFFLVVQDESGFSAETQSMNKCSLFQTYTAQAFKKHVIGCYMKVDKNNSWFYA
jgi:hypothetical protein